jgi:hypothetical protein
VSFLTLQTDFQLRLRDTDRTVATPRYTTAQYKSWINRGIHRIARESLVLRTVAAKPTPNNGSSYTLLGSGAQNLGANYYALKGFDLDYSAVALFVAPKYCQPKLVDIEEIRRITVNYANVLPITTVPKKFAVWGGVVYFDRRIPTGAVINTRYYKLPTTLSADADLPDAPLDQWDSLILSAGYLEYAYDTEDAQLTAALAAYNDELARLKAQYPDEAWGAYSGEAT